MVFRYLGDPLPFFFFFPIFLFHFIILKEYDKTLVGWVGLLEETIQDNCKTKKNSKSLADLRQRMDERFDLMMHKIIASLKSVDNSPFEVDLPSKDPHIENAPNGKSMDRRFNDRSGSQS